MQLVRLTGVLLDGATPKMYTRHDLTPVRIWRATRVQVRVPMVDQAGGALPTDGCTSRLTIREHFDDEAALWSGLGTPYTDGAEAGFEFEVPAENINVDGDYFIDCRRFDEDGEPGQVVPPRALTIGPVCGTPDTELGPSQPELGPMPARGLRLVPVADPNIALGDVGLWADGADPNAPMWRREDGTDLELGAGGGGGVSLPIAQSDVTGLVAELAALADDIEDAANAAASATVTATAAGVAAAAAIDPSELTAALTGYATTDELAGKLAATAKLANLYANQVAGNKIPLDATKGAVALEAPGTMGSTLKVTTPTQTLVDVSDNAAHVMRSTVSDGAAAVGVLVDTVNNMVNTSARSFEVRTAGTSRFSVMADGPVRLSSLRALTGLGTNVTFNGIDVTVAGTLRSHQSNVTTYLLGGSSGYWGSVWSNHFVTRLDAIAASTASTAITLISGSDSLGEFKRITMTANSNFTIVNGTGAGQMLKVRLLASGAARTATFSGTNLRGIPSLVPIDDGKSTYILVVWDSGDSKWDFYSIRENVAA